MGLLGSTSREKREYLRRNLPISTWGRKISSDISFDSSEVSSDSSEVLFLSSVENKKSHGGIGDFPRGNSARVVVLIERLL